MTKVYNRTPEGDLACAFEIPWEDHWNGRGCPRCDAETERRTNNEPTCLGRVSVIPYGL